MAPLQKLPLMGLLLLLAFVISPAIADGPVCPPSTKLSRASFPEGFLFGTATAAYQVEGAVNETCRGPALWDIYCKRYPEKEKICSVMDCRKLTLEGCTHAAQNERLPLRTVVQVLFFEQLHLRREISPTLLTEVTAGEGHVDFGRWKKTVKENQVIRMYMDTMRTRLYRLEKECLRMKKVIAKMDEENLLVATNNRQRKWSMIKKFGCKFKTYVCDSQYQTTTMVDRRSSRRYIVNKSESSSAS